MSLKAVRGQRNAEGRVGTRAEGINGGLTLRMCLTETNRARERARERERERGGIGGRRHAHLWPSVPPSSHVISPLPPDASSPVGHPDDCFPSALLPYLHTLLGWWRNNPRPALAT